MMPPHHPQFQGQLFLCSISKSHNYKSCNQRAESYLTTKRHQSLTDENGVRPRQQQLWDRTSLWSEAFERRCPWLISRKQVWELQKPKGAFPRLSHSKPSEIRPGSRKDIMLLGKWSILRWSGSVSIRKAISLGIVVDKVWDNESKTFSVLMLQIRFSSLYVPNFFQVCPTKYKIAEVPNSELLLIF